MTKNFLEGHRMQQPKRVRPAVVWGLLGGMTERLTCIPDSENLGDNAREGTTHSVGRETTRKNNKV